MKHTNIHMCPKCMFIMNETWVHPELSNWFWDFQRRMPWFHISQAGRGKIEQEKYFENGASLAKWGKSAHNYGLALDLFELHEHIGNKSYIYDKNVFDVLMAEMKNGLINWYGHPQSIFREFPHVELKNWKKLVASGEVKLLELA